MARGGHSDVRDFCPGNGYRVDQFGGSGRDRVDFSAVGHEGVIVDLKVQSRISGAAQGDLLRSIEDYRHNEPLRFDDARWGRTLLTAAQVLDFADVVGNNVVFDFGGSNTLTLENYVNLAGLVDDIEFF